MRKLLLLALCGLFSPVSASATLIGDSVFGCFSNAGCSAGVSGSFSSSSAIVSESTVEFSGTESDFTVTADFLTYNGNEVIRLSLGDPGNLDPTLAAGWQFSFFDLDWLPTPRNITGVHTDTIFQELAALGQTAESLCEGAPACLNITLGLIIIPVQTITTTSDSVTVTLAAVSTSGDWDRSIDIVLETVPEPSTALLLATGLAGFAAARRRRSLH